MTSRRFIEGAARLLHELVMAGCVFYLISYIGIALTRMAYPFDLEWMEGASVDHVRRLVTGQPIYVRPSLAFVPYLYPPFYYYVSAIVTRATGIGVLPLRLVSFVSSLGSLTIIYRFAQKETGRHRAGLLAAGLFAATYRIGGAWLDLARVDSLFLLLTLAALYFVRFGKTYSAWAAAGVLLAVAGLTKQTALVIAAPVAMYAVAAEWRRGVVLVAALVVVFGTATVALDASQPGWYLYYVFTLPSRIQRLFPEAAPFWWRDILSAMPVASIVAAVYLVARRAQARRPPAFYLIFAVALIGSSWFSRLHSGAVENVLIPAYACLAVLFALGTDALADLLPARRRTVHAIVAVLCLVQLIALRYDVRAQVPTARDLIQQQRLLALLRSVDGEVYLGHHGFFPTLAGKAPHAQAWAISDVVRSGGVEGQQLSADIRKAITDRRFRLIVLDMVDPWLEPELSLSYHRTGAVFYETGLWTRAGRTMRPSSIFVPN